MNAFFQNKAGAQKGSWFGDATPEPAPKSTPWWSGLEKPQQTTPAEPWWAPKTTQPEPSAPWWAPKAVEPKPATPWWAPKTPEPAPVTPWWVPKAAQPEPSAPWWAPKTAEAEPATPWWAPKTQQITPEPAQPWWAVQSASARSAPVEPAPARDERGFDLSLYIPVLFGGAPEQEMISVEVPSGQGDVEITGNIVTFRAGRDFDGLAEGESVEVPVTVAFADRDAPDEVETVVQTVIVTGAPDGPVVAAPDGRSASGKVSFSGIPLATYLDDGVQLGETVPIAFSITTDQIVAEQFPGLVGARDDARAFLGAARDREAAAQRAFDEASAKADFVAEVVLKLGLAEAANAARAVAEEALNAAVAARELAETALDAAQEARDEAKAEYDAAELKAGLIADYIEGVAAHAAAQVALDAAQVALNGAEAARDLAAQALQRARANEAEAQKDFDDASLKASLLNDVVVRAGIKQAADVALGAAEGALNAGIAAIEFAQDALNDAQIAQAAAAAAKGAAQVAFDAASGALSAAQATFNAASSALAAAESAFSSAQSVLSQENGLLNGAINTLVSVYNSTIALVPWIPSISAQDVRNALSDFYSVPVVGPALQTAVNAVNAASQAAANALNVLTGEQGAFNQAQAGLNAAQNAFNQAQASLNAADNALDDAIDDVARAAQDFANAQAENNIAALTAARDAARNERDVAQQELDEAVQAMRDAGFFRNSLPDAGDVASANAAAAAALAELGLAEAALLAAQGAFATADAAVGPLQQARDAAAEAKDNAARQVADAEQGLRDNGFGDLFPIGPDDAALAAADVAAKLAQLGALEAALLAARGAFETANLAVIPAQEAFDLASRAADAAQRDYLDARQDMWDAGFFVGQSVGPGDAARTAAEAAAALADLGLAEGELLAAIAAFEAADLAVTGARNSLGYEIEVSVDADLVSTLQTGLQYDLGIGNAPATVSASYDGQTDTATLVPSAGAVAAASGEDGLIDLYASILLSFEIVATGDLSLFLKVGDEVLVDTGGTQPLDFAIDIDGLLPLVGFEQPDLATVVATEVADAFLWRAAMEDGSTLELVETDGALEIVEASRYDLDGDGSVSFILSGADDSDGMAPFLSAFLPEIEGSYQIA